MFERYTESARRALFFARYETTQLGGVAIETEHVLLGILRDPRGPVSAMLAGADVSPEALSEELRNRSTFHEKVATSVEIPFSHETKRVLTRTAEEADRLGHRHIGREHMLLSLLQQTGSVAYSVLVSHGLSADRARKVLIDFVGASESVEQSDTGSVYNTPVEQVAGIRMFLQNMASTVTDEEAGALIQRICADLDALERRLR
jgi:ATP-dependent Clp protease ATP-binding subunit ClpC